jgi:hypothetical protein
MRQRKSNNLKSKATGNSKNIEGKYSNYFKVGHNAFEFVIDFGQYYAETETAELYSRIVTSPCYAKFLLEILRKSIEQYENDFGAIRNE